MDSYQERFQQSVLKGKSSAKLINEIIPGGKLDPEAALDVYRKDYRARLSNALADNFEAVWWVLGDEDFFNLCWEYIQAHPSMKPDLGEQGIYFSEFLKNHPLSKNIPFLSDLARLEWAFQEAFACEREPALSAEEVAGLNDLESRILPFKKSIRLISSPWNIHAFWQARESDDDPEINVNSENHLILHKKASDGMIYFQPMSKGGMDLFSIMLKGHSLGQALDDPNLKIEEADVQKLFSFISSEEIILK